jgi:ribosomal protein L13
VGDHCRAAHTTEIVKNTALESHRAKEPDVRGLQTIAKARCMKQNIQGMLHCGEHVRETLKSLQLYAQCYDLGGCVTVKIASIQGSRRLTFCSATEGD